MAVLFSWIVTDLAGRAFRIALPATGGGILGGLTWVPRVLLLLAIHSCVSHVWRNLANLRAFPVEQRIARLHTALPRTRYTLARPMPRRFAISVAPRPSALSSEMTCAIARAVGFRPRYLPSAFALAMPSRWRSSIMARSNSATAPIMVNISFPVAVPVSTFKLTIRRLAALPLSVSEIASRWAVDRAR